MQFELIERITALAEIGVSFDSLMEQVQDLWHEVLDTWPEDAWVMPEAVDIVWETRGWTRLMTALLQAPDDLVADFSMLLGGFEVQFADALLEARAPYTGPY